MRYKKREVGFDFFVLDWCFKLTEITAELAETYGIANEKIGETAIEM